MGMNYQEALRALGLEDDATEADVKLAYKEMAQILHPDKFADNKKLAERATEQMKQVNEARDTLLKYQGSAARGSGRRGAGARGGSGSSTGAGSRATSYTDRATSLRARLAGIAAARVQLVAQLDHEAGRRRVGIYLVVGGLACFLFGRFIKPLLAAASIAFIWGIIQIFSAQTNINTIKKHLETLNEEKLRCEKELEKT
ncbi:MAG: J domain-containing protein [Coriobacteriales bacterium]|jgi:hypothetical protein|nr:J domain-containing protein [Coriobacteriales bacterium]